MKTFPSVWGGKKFIGGGARAGVESLNRGCGGVEEKSRKVLTGRPETLARARTLLEQLKLLQKCKFIYTLWQKLVLRVERNSAVCQDRCGRGRGVAALGRNRRFFLRGFPREVPFIL